MNNFKLLRQRIDEIQKRYKSYITIDIIATVIIETLLLILFKVFKVNDISLQVLLIIILALISGIIAKLIRKDLDTKIYIAIRGWIRSDPDSSVLSTEEINSLARTYTDILIALY